MIYWWPLRRMDCTWHCRLSRLGCQRESLVLLARALISSPFLLALHAAKLPPCRVQQQRRRGRNPQLQGQTKWIQRVQRPILPPRSARSPCRPSNVAKQQLRRTRTISHKSDFPLGLPRLTSTLFSSIMALKNRPLVRLLLRPPARCRLSLQNLRHQPPPLRPQRRTRTMIKQEKKARLATLSRRRHHRRLHQHQHHLNRRHKLQDRPSHPRE